MRSDAREAAFKIVFAEMFTGRSEEKFRQSLYKSMELNEEDKQFAEDLVSSVRAHKEELTKILEEKVQNFAAERIFSTDKAALYIALAEIQYFEEIPPVVSVSEAAAIARKYSTERSAEFVNGVLGGVINA